MDARGSLILPCLLVGLTDEFIFSARVDAKEFSWNE